MNQDDINQQALELAQNSGIIFIDEIDKIRNSSTMAEKSAVKGSNDILPIMKEVTFRSKYGIISTDHMLFIGQPM